MTLFTLTILQLVYISAFPILNYTEESAKVFSQKKKKDSTKGKCCHFVVCVLIQVCQTITSLQSSIGGKSEKKHNDTGYPQEHEGLITRIAVPGLESTTGTSSSRVSSFFYPPDIDKLNNT